MMTFWERATYRRAKQRAYFYLWLGKVFPPLQHWCADQVFKKYRIISEIVKKSMDRQISEHERSLFGSDVNLDDRYASSGRFDDEDYCDDEGVENEE